MGEGEGKRGRRGEGICQTNIKLFPIYAPLYVHYLTVVNNLIKLNFTTTRFSSKYALFSCLYLILNCSYERYNTGLAWCAALSCVAFRCERSLDFQSLKTDGHTKGNTTSCNKKMSNFAPVKYSNATGGTA